MWQFLIISLFAVSAQNIVFYTHEIQCTNVDHPYTQYYGLPCDKWKKELHKYTNRVSCSIAQDNNGTLLAGCTPMFGDKDDTITVKYTVYDKSQNNTNKYSLHAEASLNDPSHPLIYLFMIALIFVIYAYEGVHFMNLPIIYRHRYMRNNNHNPDRIIWTRVR